MPGNTTPNSDKSDGVQQGINALERFVTDSLSSKRDESQRQLILFIKRTLLQFNLDQDYSPASILGEAYFRATEKIRNGEVINNVPAFLNRVAFNIIREKRRCHSRIDKIDKKHIEISKTNLHESIDSFSSAYKSEEVENLQAALHQISQDDLEILVLRIVKGLSWDEVRDHYLKKNQDLPVSRLRKRGQRALTKLRQSFFAVKQTEPS